MFALFSEYGYRAFSRQAVYGRNAPRLFALHAAGNAASTWKIVIRIYRNSNTFRLLQASDKIA